MKPATALVGTVVDEKLHLGRLIASGGMAAVFEATHLNLRARVAVKVLRPGPEFGEAKRLRRFVREARIAARLSTSHAVRVFDVAKSQDGMAYMVMEYLVGETLADLLERERQLPVPNAVEYVLQTGEALAQMHAAGMVHRDVKPSNLFLVREPNGTECVKLLDFGIAAWEDADEEGVTLTHTEVALGTPRYMAPEQIRSSKHVDARADVWSLGVTLYELLTGEPPFDARNVAVLTHQILHEDPRPIRELRPEVPHALAEAIHQCLDKDPAERPASIAALGAAIASFRVNFVPLAREGESIADTEVRPRSASDLALRTTTNALMTPMLAKLEAYLHRLRISRGEWAEWLVRAPRTPREQLVRFGAVALVVVSAVLVLRAGLRNATPLDAVSAPGIEATDDKGEATGVPATIELPVEAEATGEVTPASGATRDALRPSKSPKGAKGRGKGPLTPSAVARRAGDAVDTDGDNPVE
jgi:serine/threonine-protein kinase